jgi:hypothetical protein
MADDKGKDVENRARYAWCVTCDGWVLRSLLRAPASEWIFDDVPASAGKVCPAGHAVQDTKPGGA